MKHFIKLINDKVKDLMRIEAYETESLCGRFLKETGLSVTDCVLVRSMRDNDVIFFIREKTEDEKRLESIKAVPEENEDFEESLAMLEKILSPSGDAATSHSWFVVRQEFALLRHLVRGK